MDRFGHDSGGLGLPHMYSVSECASGDVSPVLPHGLFPGMCVAWAYA